MAANGDRGLERPSSAATVEQRATRLESSPASADELRGLTDSDLLALMRSGDVDALGVIYDRHVQAVWKVALSLAESPKAAEQAVLAAFIRLWREPVPGERASLPTRLLSSVWLEASRGSASPITPH